MSRQSEASWLFGQATDRPQKDLADKIGRSQTTVSHVLSGVLAWTPGFESGLFAIVGNAESVLAIKQAAQRARTERMEHADV